jgi:hypothetical protein
MAKPVRTPPLPASLFKPGTPMRMALDHWRLTAIPRSVHALVEVALQRHPEPERSWSWADAAAYRVLHQYLVATKR